MNSYLRPDEAANLTSQKRVQDSNQNLKQRAKLVGSAAASFVGGGGLAARLTPFFSEFLTPELAVKGISKISPPLGEILKKGMEKGLDIKEGLNFLKDKISPQTDEKSQPAKENRNVFQQYSPELDQFISNEVKQGKDLIETVGRAYKDKKFKNIMDTISKDHNADIFAIAEATYQQANSKQAPRVPTGRTAEQAMYSSQPQAPQQAPQAGNSDAALMAAFDKILKM